MTETPQELIARLTSGDARPQNCRFRLQDEGKSYGRSSCSACGKSIFTGLGTSCTKGVPDLQRLATELAASLAREVAETARCCRIITAARMGDIDGDFRSMLHFVTSGNQMLYVEAAGKYMHDSKRGDYEAIAALEKEGGE